MIVEPDVNWVPKDWTTGTGTVEDLKEVRDEQGRLDRQLHFESDGHKYKLSLWGGNLNNCISKWGKNTDIWRGKHFFLLKESKPNEKAKIILSPQ